MLTMVVLRNVSLVNVSGIKPRNDHADIGFYVNWRSRSKEKNITGQQNGQTHFTMGKEALISELCYLGIFQPMYLGPLCVVDYNGAKIHI